MLMCPLKLRRRQERKNNLNVHNCHFWAEEMPLSSPKTNKKRELMRDQFLCTNKNDKKGYPT